MINHYELYNISRDLWLRRKKEKEAISTFRFVAIVSTFLLAVTFLAGVH